MLSVLVVLRVLLLLLLVLLVVVGVVVLVVVIAVVLVTVCVLLVVLVVLLVRAVVAAAVIVWSLEMRKYIAGVALFPHRYISHNSALKNPIVFITFRGGEFSHRIKVALTLKPLAYFSRTCKTRREVFKKR